MVTGSSDPRQSLEELLVALNEAEDSEQAFLDLILDSAARRDEELPNILRAGAIPRTLNTTIVGVLRGLPDDVERNRDLLEQVAGYGFVVTRPDGGLTYHDNTRDALLADWRSTGPKRATFGELNTALATFYENRYAEHRTSERRLNDVSHLIARANPGRLRRLTEAVEADMTADLLEATYHRLLADPQDGFEFFKSTFFELEVANRVDICRSLISFIQDFLQRLPPDEEQPNLLAWLDYFDSRVQRLRPDYDADAVELVLQRLRERDDLNDKLRTWTLDDLAMMYEEQLEFRAALGVRRELADRLGVDPWNDPLRLSNLAALHRSVGDYAAAKHQFQLALQYVDEVEGARQDTGVFARLDLSEMYAEIGEWDSAFAAATDAFYRARTSFANDVAMQRYVATRFAQLLATFDPRASDCAASEAIALTEGGLDDRLISALTQIDNQLYGHRLRTARASIDHFSDSIGDRDNESPLRLGLAYREGKLAELEERPADAYEIYSTMLDGMALRRGNDPVRISTLIRQVANRMKLGDAVDVVADLTPVRDDLQRRGCVDEAARVDSLLAEAMLEAGDLAVAQERLHAARTALPPETCLYRLLLLTVEGDLFRQLESSPAAEQRYREALEMATGLRAVNHQLELLRKLSSLHTEQGRTHLSSEDERRAELVREERAQADGFNPTAAERPAESQHARGMQSFCEDGDRVTALERARLHLVSARDLDPDNLWPLLNLSVVYAEQEDWEAASEALQRARELSPVPLRTARLSSSLRDYALEHAKSLLRRRDADRAADVSGAAIATLAAEPAATTELLPLRVVNCAALAVAGDSAAALDSGRAALAAAVPAGADLFVDGIASLVDTVESYWPIDDLLHELEHRSEAPTGTTALAARARAELVDRLGEILGLTRSPTEEIPVVTPTVVEIGDAVVPIVDSRLDGGVFLYELIPAMRERIRSTTGLTVPGVRMRGNPVLGLAAYLVEVDEVPVLLGSVGLGRTLSVLPFVAEERPSAKELSDIHPLTGEPGLWLLAVPSGDDGGEADELTGAQYLVHRIELALRAHLVRYLGPQEVSMLVDTWLEQDAEGLVPSVLPDEEARLRITWVLQALVDEGVPLVDWQTVLATIRDAGGIEVPIEELRRAVRAGLRGSLPGPQTGRTLIPVPAEHEHALMAKVEAGPGIDPERDVLRWLRRTVAETGPAIILVTRTQEGREYVSALARTEDRLITTLSQAEMEPS